MRTTLTIDDDVLDRARSLARKISAPLRGVINDALRAGLDAVEKPALVRPYRTSPSRMGLKPGKNVDNVQELLAQIEEESHR